MGATNIKELIELYQDIVDNGYVCGTTLGNYKTFIGRLKQLEESQKPTVPQFVADWYEKHKDNFDESVWEYLVNWEENEWDKFKEWFSQSHKNKAIVTLANMHQFGYKIEKKGKYNMIVKDYKNNGESITYTLDYDIFSVNVEHKKTSEGVDVTDLKGLFDWLDEQEVSKVPLESFLSFQNSLLLEGESLDFAMSERKMTQNDAKRN